MKMMNLKDMEESSYLLGLQGSNMHHQQPPHASLNHQNQQMNLSDNPESMIQLHDIELLLADDMHDPNQEPTVPIMDCNRSERGKIIMIDDDDLILHAEDGIGHNETDKGNTTSLWQRVRWVDEMVKLLINAVSYIAEDAAAEDNAGGKRMFSIIQKKGKWKLVSKVMGERGFYVSPQQCEDKFNDLNKRFKKLNYILGRGTSCNVVENPALLDLMNHLSDKAKDEVRKILNSKQLFYEQMCSYHNGNRLDLPDDPALQRSLKLALMKQDENGARRGAQDDIGDDGRGTDTDDKEDDAGERSTLHGSTRGLCFQKRKKLALGNDDLSSGNSLTQDCNRRRKSQGIAVEMNQVFPEGSKAACMKKKKKLTSRALQLKKQKLQVQEQMLELEKERFEWQQSSKLADRELDKMRMENEKMKLENERLAMENQRMAMQNERLAMELKWNELGLNRIE